MCKFSPNPPDNYPASLRESRDSKTMKGPRRNSLLGIAQVIMLGELAVNRALDQLDPPE